MKNKLSNFLDQIFIRNAEDASDGMSSFSMNQLLNLKQFIESDAVYDRLIKAPASSSKSKHHSYEGGLADHILEMCMFVPYLVGALYQGLATKNKVELFNTPSPSFSSENMPDITQDDFINMMYTCVFLHDLSKIGDAEGNSYYVENILKSGKVSEAKPYSVDTEKFLSTQSETLPINNVRLLTRFHELYKPQLEDGKLSISLVSLISPSLYETLTPYQIQAITYHALGYGSGKYEIAGKENFMTILLHTVDMLSSRL